MIYQSMNEKDGKLFEDYMHIYLQSHVKTKSKLFHNYNCYRGGVHARKLKQRAPLSFHFSSFLDKELHKLEFLCACHVWIFICNWTFFFYQSCFTKRLLPFTFLFLFRIYHPYVNLLRVCPLLLYACEFLFTCYSIF